MSRGVLRIVVGIIMDTGIRFWGRRLICGIGILLLRTGLVRCRRGEGGVFLGRLLRDGVGWVDIDLLVVSPPFLGSPKLLFVLFLFSVATNTLERKISRRKCSC